LPKNDGEAQSHEQQNAEQAEPGKTLHGRNRPQFGSGVLTHVTKKAFG
jgi:pantothenate synthetase